MATLESVQFDTQGFSRVSGPQNAHSWLTADGDGVALHYLSIAPDIAVPLSDLAGLRRFYQGIAYGGGLGVIEVELSTLDGCSAVRTIFKTPQVPHGITYLGSLTLPFRDFSYVVQVQCPEQGTTGTRDTAVLVDLLKKGLVKPMAPSSEPARLSGWMRDPYDATIDEPLMWNPSEAEEYDASFPAHPLSRLRRILHHIERTVVLDAHVRSAAPFAGGGVDSTLRW